MTTVSEVFADMVLRLAPLSIASAACRVLPLSLVALLLISACSSDDEAAEQAGTRPVSSSEFPNLATVPDEAPPVTPRPQREQLLQGLMADRANAEYTDELLDAGSARVPPAPPPPPAPPLPEGSPGGSEASDAPADGETTIDAQTDAGQPQTAALPADLGQPAALIYFDQGSADLTDRERAILHDVTVMYQRQRANRVRVVGHASSAEAGEADIAMARANAVAGSLTEQGVPASVIEIVTGAGGPVYDESQPTGAAANRRVEVFLGF